MQIRRVPVQCYGSSKQRTTLRSDACSQSMSQIQLARNRPKKNLQYVTFLMFSTSGTGQQESLQHRRLEHSNKLSGRVNSIGRVTQPRQLDQTRRNYILGVANNTTIEQPECVLNIVYNVIQTSFTSKQFQTIYNHPVIRVRGVIFHLGNLLLKIQVGEFHVFQTNT